MSTGRRARTGRRSAHALESPAVCSPQSPRASRDHQVQFEAYIPETGNWIASDRERSKVTLYASLEAGARLTAATPGLVDRVLVVNIREG